MTIWFLEQQQALELERARAARALSSAELEAFERIATSANATTIARVAGDVAEIPIVGILTKGRDRLAWVLGMGNTTYADVRDALAGAESNASIKRIVLRVDSPGGMVEGLFETIDAIAACTKPITAVCSQACSAAYALACAAQKIEATGRDASFGSIGIATSFSFWADQQLIELTNTDSPNKRPDPRTDEGQAVIRKHLDALAALFIDAIARGRRVKAADVRANYGRGAVLLAKEAKALGMIDSIRGVVRPATGSAALATPAPGSAMAHVREALLPLLRGTPPAPAREQQRDDEDDDGAPTTHGSTARDLGDQIVELLDAQSEGREPAAWAVPSPASSTPHTTGDLGDAIVAVMDSKSTRAAS
jgi:ClpP class serine protease